MDNKKVLRNLLLYAGIPIIVFFIIYFMFNRASTEPTVKYSDIINYFETEQVTEYKLDLGTGQMILTLDDESKSKIKYIVPNVGLFYENVDDLSLTEDDVGRVAALVYSKSNPKWTAKDIEQFMQAMTVTAKTSAKVVNAESLDEVIDIAVDSISDALASSMNKAKTDEGNIMEFLRHLK